MFSSRVALIVPVGLGDTTKSDDFLTKKIERGRSFSIQKFILQILVLYIVFLDGFRKNQYHFLERPFGIVPKIHPIWYYLGLGGRFAGRAASFSLEWDVHHCHTAVKPPALISGIYETRLTGSEF